MEPGTRFGPYEILSPLGTGGMGEVYRARDRELGREVAIKVLRAELAEDRTLVARLEREARLLAGLEHPRVARLYAFAEAEGRTYLAMELVEGESLADRLARGPLSVRDALLVCAQIAEGLEAAHLAGVVHRDLKPANVLLDCHGDARIADFGIARSFRTAEPGAAATSLPTSAEDLTGQGVPLGTAPYMSPEQARGDLVDARTDVWALGCTLYECLTGKAPFERKTAADTTRAILTEEPDPSALPPDLLPRVRRLLGRMLSKDARDRQRSAGDVWLELREASEPDVVLDPPASGASLASRLRLAGGVLLVAAATLAIAWVLVPDPAAPARAARRFEIDLPPGIEWKMVVSPVVAIAPDGQSMVMNIDERLWLRRLDSVVSTLLPGAENVRTPVYSPDARHLAFWQTRKTMSGYDGDGRLVRLALDGGSPVPLLALPEGPPDGASWASDGYLYLDSWDGAGGIMRVPETGGAPETVAPGVPGEFTRGPRLVPGTNWLLFEVTHTSEGDRFNLPDWAQATIVAQSLLTGERHELVEGTSVRYVSTGHLTYAVGHDLMAVTFDRATATVTGDPVRVLEGVHRAGSTAPMQYDLSADGDLVYLAGAEAVLGSRAVWAGRDGVDEPTPFEPAVLGMKPALSPDGKRLAIDRYHEEPDDIWIHDLETGTREPFAGGGRSNSEPVWSHDGEWIYFASAPSRREDTDIWRRRVDSADPAEPVLAMEGSQRPTSLSASGDLLLFNHRAPEATDSETTGPEEAAPPVWALSLNGPPEARPILDSTESVSWPSLSPDGRFVAFQVGLFPADIYVRELVTGRTWPVSTARYHGMLPVWSPDGDRIFFLSSGRVVASEDCPTCPGRQVLEVDVRFDPTFAVSEPRPVARAQNRWLTRFEVGPGGDRFLVIRYVFNPAAFERSDPVLLVLDWFADLQGRGVVPR